MAGYLNYYQRQRQRYHTEYQAELSQLDKRFADNRNSPEYWETYKSIIEKYNKIFEQIDSNERDNDIFIQAKEGRSTTERPEATYADKLGQLKGEKMRRLSVKLYQVTSSDTYKERKAHGISHEAVIDPISTFEEWWNDYLLSYPSIESVVNFLNHIDLDSTGYLMYCDNEIENPQSNPTDDYVQSSATATISGYRQTYGNMRGHRKTKATLQQEFRKRNPILAALPDKGEHARSLDRKRKSFETMSKLEQEFSSVVDAYELSVDVRDLLYDHISVCISKGMYKIDDYRSMLEQFLRFVPSDKERIYIIERAIQQKWKVLSNGEY